MLMDYTCNRDLRVLRPGNVYFNCLIIIKSESREHLYIHL